MKNPLYTHDITHAPAQARLDYTENSGSWSSLRSE